jgi:hypothetical protein
MGYAVGHSPPPGNEVINEGSHTSTPPIMSPWRGQTTFPLREFRLPPLRNEKCAFLGYYAAYCGNVLPTPVTNSTTLCVVTHKSVVINFTFTSELSGHRTTTLRSRHTLNG